MTDTKKNESGTQKLGDLPIYGGVDVKARARVRAAIKHTRMPGSKWEYITEWILMIEIEDKFKVSLQRGNGNKKGTLILASDFNETLVFP